MKSFKVFFVLYLILLFIPFAQAQDFADELEAELEAELNASEENTVNDGAASAETSDSKMFEDFESSNESGPAGENSVSENSDGEDAFGESSVEAETFEDAFSDADFKDEDFNFDDFNEEEAIGAVPVESQDLDQATDDLQLEPVAPIQEVQQPEEVPPEPSIPEQNIVEEKPVFTEPIADFSADTGPNLDYEARLYSIYVNYNNTPTSESTWNSLLGGRQSEVYSIQSGDTLWGISQTFFGDGQFWPKIWSVNNRIGNPHLISAGNQIQFVMGTESDAPMFTVSEAEATPQTPGSGQIDLDLKTINELIESGALDASDAKQFEEVLKKNKKAPPEMQAKNEVSQQQTESYPEPEIEIPPPSIVSRPVLKKLPPSVPEWQNTNRVGDYDDLGISYSRRPIADLKDEIYLSSYIDDNEEISEATVIEIETGSSIAWELQYVYVRFPIGKAIPGAKYLVVDNIGELREANDYIESSQLGYQKVISGMVTIGEKVKSDVDERKYEVYRAFVDKAVHPISLNGQLVEGRLPLINLNDVGPKSNIVAQIIGGNLDKRRTVFGKSSVVFLNRGREDGIADGQILHIRANRFVRNHDSRVLENQRVIGKLKIVKAVEHFATAVIIESNENILAGDFTGEGTLLPRLVKDQIKRATEINSDEPEMKNSSATSDGFDESDFSVPVDESFNETFEDDSELDFDDLEEDFENFE